MTSPDTTDNGSVSTPRSAQPSRGVTTNAAAIQIPASTQRVWLTSRASGGTVETSASRQTQTTPLVGPKAAMTAEAATRPKPKPATPWDTAPTPTRRTASHSRSVTRGPAR